MARLRVTTDAPWADRVAYSRAVRVGEHVHVSGTAPVSDDGSPFAPGDAYLQAKRCIEIVQNALREAGAELRDVIRTRIYVTDITRWEEIGRAHREAFQAHPPATTLVEVRRLVHEDMLVEIEAEAMVETGG